MIVASGPSFRAEDARAFVGLVPILGVNNTFFDVPLTVHYACDGSWWDRFHSQTYGERWTCDEGAARRYGLNWIHGVPGDGLAPSRSMIRFGNNSGHQAINLAARLGARRIFLLGFDCKLAADGRKHYHADHGPGLTNPSRSTLLRWTEGFKTLALDCVREGIEVINLSRETALDCFRRRSVEDQLNELAARGYRPRTDPTLSSTAPQ